MANCAVGRKEKIYKIYTEGPGYYDSYSIHQIEQIVMLMNCCAKRIMGLGDTCHPSMIIEFEDGRYAQFRQCLGAQFKITTTDEENMQKEYKIEYISVSNK